MRILRSVLLCAATIVLVWFLDGIRTQALPLAMGRFLDPFHGFWQNAASETPDQGEEVDLEGLQAPVTVHYDARDVPHVFAQNDHDLYFMQGYLTARDRLWQMDFQTMAAAGRLSEVIANPRVWDIDRLARRMGMVKAAEAGLAVTDADPMSKGILDAYTAGVNAWIHSLSSSDYPMEYKLLDYAPEAWTTLKTHLLLKMMARNLTSRSEDFMNTNAAAEYGMAVFEGLYPSYSDSSSPIIPRGTPWDFQETVSVDTPALFVPGGIVPKLEYEQPQQHLGSNNWAVSGKKSKSGYPILCNDPHLGLSLPSIWYEIQLSTPEHSARGVSLPGAPMIIIGFNQNVAWGVTNGARDVLDWYHIEFNEARTEYKHGGAWKPVTQRVERIDRLGKAAIVDTVLYTHHGPVVYDRNFADPKGEKPVDLAMRWAAHDGSNEMLTFYGLNRATSYADYRAALQHYTCPAQNFIFASNTGDIAITQQGKFPAKWPGQGRFIMDGSNPLHDWQAYIPSDQNPTVKNPAREFVFSANQHATSAEYPYDIAGIYDYTRSRRLTQALTGMQAVTVADMQQLQNDNYNQVAAETLPRWLAQVDASRLSPQGKTCFEALKRWNYFNDADLHGPSAYEYWKGEAYWALFKDDLHGNFLAPTPKVSSYIMAHILADTAPHPMIDDVSTEAVETRADLLTNALNKAADALEEWKTENEGVETEWWRLNDVHVLHLSRQKAFSRFGIHTGGNHGIVNATRKNTGPSWRMVVALGPEPEAYGVYPGGQSGNPGHPGFDAFIDTWAAGKYYPLYLMKSAEAPGEGAVRKQSFQPNN